MLKGKDVGGFLSNDRCLGRGAAGGKGEDAKEVIVDKGRVSHLGSVEESLDLSLEVDAIDCGGILTAGDECEGVAFPVGGGVWVEKGNAVREVGGEARVGVVGGGVGHGGPG